MYSPHFAGYPPIIEQLMHAAATVVAPTMTANERRMHNRTSSIIKSLQDNYMDRVFSLADINAVTVQPVYNTRCQDLVNSGFISEVKPVGRQKMYVLTEKGKNAYRS